MPMHIRNHPSVAYANQYNTPSEASSYGGGDNTRANTNTSEAGEIDSKHSIPNGYTPKMQGKVQRSFGYREMPRIPVFSAFRDAEEFHYANKVFADRMLASASCGQYDGRKGLGNYGSRCWGDYRFDTLRALLALN